METFRRRVRLLKLKTCHRISSLPLKEPYSAHYQALSFYFVATFVTPVSLRPLPLLNTRPPLIGRLTHAWASTANNKGAAVLNQFQSDKPDNEWHDVMSRCHSIKGGATDEAFRRSVFCGILCVLPQSFDGGMLLCFQTTWRTGGRWCWRTNPCGPSAPARRPRPNRWRWLTASTFFANSPDATRSVNQRRMTHVVLFIVAAWCVSCDGGCVQGFSIDSSRSSSSSMNSHEGVCRIFKRLKMSWILWILAPNSL